MAHDGKIRTITNFVIGVELLKKEVKADAQKMMAAVPLDVLGDPIALEEYLAEMLDAALSKHIITQDRKIRPEAARLIKGYVGGMR